MQDTFSLEISTFNPLNHSVSIPVKEEGQIGDDSAKKEREKEGGNGRREKESMTGEEQGEIWLPRM